MNLTEKYALICTSLLIAATGTINAQDSQQRQQNVPLQGQSQIFFRADKLVGQSAQTPVGQNLGKISEIVFNTEKGIFGIVKADNDRLVALPWTLVTAVTDKAVVFNTSPQALAGAPSFTDKQWSKLNDPQFTAQLESHFKQPGASSGRTSMGGSSSPENQGTTSAGSDKDATSAPQSTTNSASANESQSESDTDSK